MSYCDYDRKLLQELRDIFYDIREILSKSLELDTKALERMASLQSQRAEMTKSQLQFQLDLLEDLEED